MSPPVILGVSASLRNARFGRGSESLVTEIQQLGDKVALQAYLQSQSKIITEQFFDAGRSEGLPFDELYKRFKSSSGDRGLSNSECAVVAALFGAMQSGCEIDHVSLSKHFLPSGENKDLDALREKILQADGIIVGGPVYFGDRGSLAQSFIEFLGADDELVEHLQGRVYGGVAVGAKRNGGQETNLIYQLIDLTNLGMLGVGNDSETTSQYGGTAVAGDVGSCHTDDYGIDTCIGTGRRVASVAASLRRSADADRSDRVRIDIWVLQDSPEKTFETHFSDLQSLLSPETRAAAEIRVRNVSQAYVRRCIACDICPTDIGPAHEYRCIITAKRDLFVNEHSDLIDTDAVLLAAYSPKDRRNINSQYQRFIERTRYWRRDDYLLGDLAMAPFVISEVGANQNLHLRMMTSAVRHHTVLHRPIIGFEQDGAIINRADMAEALESFVRQSARLTTSRLASAESADERVYNPMGYVISHEKVTADQQGERWTELLQVRSDERQKEALDRLAAQSSHSPGGNS